MKANKYDEIPLGKDPQEPDYEPPKMKCPVCRSMKHLKPSRQIYAEYGEWDGKKYEFEDHLDGFYCEECGITFWWMEGRIMPKEGDRPSETGLALERTRDGFSEG